MDDQDNNDQDKTTVKGTVDVGVKKELEPEMIRDIFAEALKENKVDGKLPGMMLEMLDAAINSSKKKAASDASPSNVIQLEPAEPTPPPKPSAPREPSPFEQEVQANIRQAVADYISDSVSAEQVQQDNELNIDAAFLKDHGAALAGSVLGAFAKSIIPDDFKLDVTPGADGQQDADATKDQVSVKLDIGGMLKTLFDASNTSTSPTQADDE